VAVTGDPQEPDCICVVLEGSVVQHRRHLGLPHCNLFVLCVALCAESGV